MLNNFLDIKKYKIFNAYSNPEYKMEDDKYVNIGCDGGTQIYRFPKDKLNITFNEFRQNIYFYQQNWNHNKGELIKWFTEDKLTHKENNKKLHDLFYRYKKINFKKILDDFLYLHTWIGFPKRLDFNVINARYVGINDGNEQSIVAEDELNFYYAESYGS